MPATEEDKPVMTTPSTVATVDVRIILAGLWTALMLIYLLGDVLRIFAGDFEPGRMQGQAAGQWMWLVAAAVMLVPIAMIVLSLMLPYPAIRWVTWPRRRSSCCSTWSGCPTRGCTTTPSSR